MATSPPKHSQLTDRLPRQVLQRLQDTFSSLAGVSVVIQGSDGHSVTRPSRVNQLCRLLGASHLGPSTCATCGQAEGEQSAVRLAEESLTCPAGLPLLSVPIVVGGNPVGRILIEDRPTGGFGGEQLASLARRFELPIDRIREAAAQVAPWTDAERQAALSFARDLAGVLGLWWGQSEQLEERIEELSTVYRVAGLLAGQHDLDEILSTTARLAADVLRVRACSLRLLNAETGELTVRAVHNLSKGYLDKGPILLQDSPIDAQALAGETVYVANAPKDPRTQYPEEAQREGIVSCLVVGMFHAGQPVGVLRVYAARPREFSAFEAAMLRALAATSAAAIVNAQLFAQRLQAEDIRRQLRIAGEVQRRLTPRFAPRHAHAEFGFFYEPTYEVGGDYFDFISLPEEHWGLAVADVIGKGVPAGLLMASLRSTLRVYAGTLYEIAEIISRINVQICNDTLPSEFITAFYGVLSADARQLSYVNAGHEPPILLRHGEPDLINPTGGVLGICTEESYGLEVLRLQPGDLLALYSDGLTEASNFEGERFGRDRLIASLQRFAHLQAPQVAKNVLWDIRRFKGLADQTDDMTLVVAKIT